MEQLDLDTAFTTKGIPHIAFWNGRVLTAEDLRDEQLANLLARNQIGRAVGPGVVSGFDVVPGGGATDVVVSAGLAVDGLGQVVELPVDIDLNLVVPPETASGDGLFTVCDPVTSNTPTGTGVYVLVVRPASADRASSAGVPAFGDGVATECGPKYSVDGVSFRLIGMDAAALGGAIGHDAADVETLDGVGSVVEGDLARNVLAHLFLDTIAWAQRFGDPFGANASSTALGALSELRASTLLPCEVPIAVITWSFDGVGFVDVWAARRPPSIEHAVGSMAFLGTATRGDLGRAVYSQFQAQLRSTVAELGAAAREAFVLTDRFRYLPAAGLVPIARPDRAGLSAGVFGDLVVRGPVPIDPDRVRALLDESFHHAPIDLERGEVTYVYQVLTTEGDAVDHVVFCTSRMEFLGDELVIDAVFPAGLLSLGQQIEIRGRNFGFSTGDARVTFDDQNANPQAGSSDGRLIVAVPLGLDVDADGSEVTLEVSSNAGSDSVPVMVGLPDLEPVGTLVVEWLAVEPATVEAGQPATVSYRLVSTVSPAVDVELLLDGTQSVLDEATLLDAAGDAIVAPIRMAADDEVELQVEIAQVPDIPSFTLAVGARVVGHPDIEGSDSRPFPVGEPTPPADPAITILTPPDVDVQLGTGTATLSGSTLTISDGAVVDLEFSMRVTQAGIYRVRVEPSSLSPPWPSVLSQPAGGEFPTIPPNEFVGDGEAFREIRVTVSRDSVAIPAPSAVTLIVNRPGRTDDARVTYQLTGS